MDKSLVELTASEVVEGLKKGRNFTPRADLSS